jgi:hypothetical protein
VKTEATGSSETLVTIYKATNRHDPDNQTLNFHYQENLKFYTSFICLQNNTNIILLRDY